MNMDVNQVRLGESAENKKLYSKYNLCNSNKASGRSWFEEFLDDVISFDTTSIPCELHKVEKVEIRHFLTRWLPIFRDWCDVP